MDTADEPGQEDGKQRFAALRSPRWWSWWLAGLLVVLLFVAAPMPFMIFSPQAPTPVDAMIRMEGADRPLSGQLLASSVGYRRGTPALALWALIDPGREIVSEPNDVPASAPTDELRNFDDSVLAAAKVGLGLAGYDVPVTSQGLEVVGVTADGAAAGRLAEGDVLLTMDGQTLVLPNDLRALVLDRSPGDVVSFRLRRNGEERTVEVTIGVSSDGNSRIGVATVAVQPIVHFPAGIAVSGTGDYEGGSAGLLLALAVYDRFADEPLLDGRTVIGTGSIDLAGGVHSIDGIAQKVRAAADSGAEVFLTPAEQYEEAAAAADGIRVVGVGSIDEAIDFLRSGRVVPADDA